MSRRNKSILEKWFSISRHVRRGGAKYIFDNINLEFSKLKKTTIDGEKITYTHGSSNNLEAHLKALKDEFAGQSALCYEHAKIIVLLRRDFKTSENFKIFEKLWKEEKKFLLKNLNTRWLISAADTFADFSSNDTERAIAIACSCLLNTVKIQESERFITNAILNMDDPEKLKRLDNYERISLFDGTSVFKFGTDDTLRNMRWRIDKISKLHPTGEILLEVFLRLQKYDTVFKRTKDRHTRKKTGWW